MFGQHGGHRLGGGGGGHGGHAGGGYDQIQDGEAWPGCIFGAAVAAVMGLVAVGLAVLSLGSVPPLQYGIRYNHFTKAAELTQTYVPGRYFIGPFNRFLYFPSDVQNIEFAEPSALRASGIRYEPLHTRTKEGLGLHLQVALQYKLMPDKIGRLYDEFNMNFESVYTSSVRDILIKAASEYEATQLWENRDSFGTRMQQMVDAELRKAYAECWGLQLLMIDLPDDFEQSITRTQVQKQNLYMREQEQMSSQIRAETTVIQAEYEKKVKVIMAHGQANYTVTTKEAEARAQQKKIDVESRVLASMKDTLHLSSEGLVSYQKYGALDDLDQATVFFGFQGPSNMMLSGQR